jgi:hypothetical protein
MQAMAAGRMKRLPSRLVALARTTMAVRLLNFSTKSRSRG